MTTMTAPSAPLGPYPQLRLCGQLGSAPTNSRIRRINTIVPNDMEPSNSFYASARFNALRPTKFQAGVKAGNRLAQQS
jgi:hypothetical protein